MFAAFASSSPILAGALASLLAGLATAVGALPDPRHPKALRAGAGRHAGLRRRRDARGLVLFPDHSRHGGRPGAGGGDHAGCRHSGDRRHILLGAASLWLVRRYLPHEHFILGRQGPDAPRFRRIWLFVIAITLHNFPEGLAVGVGFGGDDLGKAVALAIGIGLQKMPEGLAVAVAVSQALLPWRLAYAGGAMIFVISDEIIPEIHRRGFETHGTVGLMIGLVVMRFLDVMLE